eukprot:TRINITY_DN124832_c0_g1_i1.p1 TRINITY_DN124832_c0_g1~~TRINITY_DN124832_c0_g1_i1.p1  ORF type:complete len:274 (+),score=84.09 TRINITY_DN124832_c0_g1_i1:76-897(+)
MARVLALLALATVAKAGQVGKFLKQHLSLDSGSDSLVKALQFKHQLRVCNAYPLAEPLDVFLGESDKLTSDSPLPYKGCRDFAQQLKAGDKLQFKVGEDGAGTFAVADLPDNDAVLLLVIHRHDPSSTAVSFESHVFGNNESPQVAVIDTYKGSAKGMPKIKDHVLGKKHHGATRSEELRYNSVIAVSQGQYDVVLDDESGSELSKSNLVALKHGSYVVMRTGVESKQGESYPEELVVFPQADPHALPHSGAAGHLVGSAGLMASLFAMAMAC